MKKVVLLILTLSICLGSLYGCGMANTTTQKDQPNTNEPVSTENITEPSSDETIPSANDSDPSDATDIGGTDVLCPVHDENYHSFSSALIDYIGEVEFMEWIDKTLETEHKDGCYLPEQTLYRLIHDFNIPRSFVEPLYYNVLYDSYVWNIDLMYGSDEKAIDDYYRDLDTISSVSHKRSNFGAIKTRIMLADLPAYQAAFAETPTNSISLIQMVNELSIPREKLEEYASGFVSETYEINFDAIYGESSSVQINSNNNPDPYPVRASDALICGIDDYELE